MLELEFGAAQLSHGAVSVTVVGDGPQTSQTVTVVVNIGGIYSETMVWENTGVAPVQVSVMV